MSYNPNIPVITDPILQSNVQMRANFLAIDNAFSDNHASLVNSDETQGMHNVLTMRNQALDPTTGGTETALYSKLVSSIPMLFFRPRANQTPIQLTYPSLVNTGVNQYSFTAGPFIIYGGLVTNPTNGQTVTLATGTTLIFVDIIVSSLGVDSGNVIASACPTNVTGTSFDITFSPSLAALGNFNIYYFAVGV